MRSDIAGTFVSEIISQPYLRTSVAAVLVQNKRSEPQKSERRYTAFAHAESSGSGHRLQRRRSMASLPASHPEEPRPFSHPYLLTYQPTIYRCMHVNSVSCCTAEVIAAPPTTTGISPAYDASPTHQWESYGSFAHLKFICSPCLFD